MMTLYGSSRVSLTVDFLSSRAVDSLRRVLNVMNAGEPFTWEREHENAKHQPSASKSHRIRLRSKRTEAKNQ